jgi:hypothetical protein
MEFNLFDGESIEYTAARFMRKRIPGLIAYCLFQLVKRVRMTRGS